MVQIAHEGSTQLGAMLNILKAQKEKASGKSLDLSKAFISCVHYIFSWDGLYQNAILHIGVPAQVGKAILFCKGFEYPFLRRDLSRSVFAKQCAIRIDKQQKERYNFVVIYNDVII